MTEDTSSVRFSCDKCQAKYNIADDKVRGKVVAVKCTKCGNRITVNGKLLDQPEEREEATRMVSMDALNAALRGEAPADEPPPAPRVPPPPAAPSAPAIGDGWYALINGEQQGPLTAVEVLAHVRSGALTGATYAWRDGMADWKPANDIAELKAALAPPAPPPPPARPPPPATVDDGSGASTMVASKEVLAQLKAQAGLSDEAAPASEPAPAAAPAQPQKPAGAVATGAVRPSPEIASAPGPDLDDLFGDVPSTNSSGKPLDLDSPLGGASEPEDDPFAAAAKNGNDDPFASVPDDPNMQKQPEIGEQTRFFIAQSGVNKRNPPWKIALFVLGLPALLFGVVFALAQLRIVPMEIKQVDAETGEVVSTPIFSGEGISGLRDKLLGKTPVIAPRPKAKAAKKTEAAADEKPLIEKKQLDPKMTQDQIAAAAQLMRGDDRGPVGPEVRKENVDKLAVDSAAAGLDQKVIGETFAKNIRAFQACNETEIRRNPSFKGGKINITFTIGPSGTVTKTAIDKQDIDKSSLGDCLKDKAKRVVFPSFEGDAFDVEIPLVLTKGS